MYRILSCSQQEKKAGNVGMLMVIELALTMVLWLEGKFRNLEVAYLCTKAR